jgi:iron(III) transport system substrate-binding protein
MSMRDLMAGISRRTALKTAAAAALLGTFGAGRRASAQTMDDLSSYKAADRTQKLIEGAKKEGTVSIYSSATTEDMKALTTAFEKKYGIKTVTWRASGENVLQRSVTEARANRFDVDAFETDGPIMESLHREKLLQPQDSPVFADLVPDAVRPHKEWIGDRIQVFTAAYNTDAVKKSDQPKSYEDLLDPKWKGKLGIEAEDKDWLAQVCAELGEDKALKLFRDIVAKNGISVRKGHTLLAQLVVSGEVPLALTTYLYKAQQLKNDGAPIEWFALPPEIGRFQGTGVAKKAPHPHAALLFTDWLLTEGQEILAKRDFLPTNIKVKPLPDLGLKFVDPAKILDENDKWDKLYKEIFLDQSKAR